MIGKHLIPVRGCVVQDDRFEDIGIVESQRVEQSHAEVEVLWSRRRTRGWCSPEELSCGFSESMWVSVPSAAGEPPRVGQIVAFRELGGQFQALVDLPDSGIRIWLPFQLLSRRMDVQEKLVRGKLALQDTAERFRLKCLAYGLEIWNENTGALSGLNIEPLPHQVSLVHRILASGNLNWLIADDVGLGKTIEVGLLLNAFLQKSPDARILIVCPAGLTRQWQEELRHKFGLQDFEIYGDDFNIRYSDQWYKKNRVIGSVDRLKQEDHRETLRQVNRWDLVVFDEAHRLTRHERGNSYDSSGRYELAAELRRRTDSMLLLTATPHQGKDDLFRSLLMLLRPELREQINLLSHNREILLDMVIRNPKAQARDWDGHKIFRGKDVHTVSVEAPQGIQEFTRALQAYFKEGYRRANALGGQGRAIGFVMTVYRKLAASSIYSIVQALSRRLERIEGSTRVADFAESLDERDSRYRGEQEESVAHEAGLFFEGEEYRLKFLIEQGRKMIPQDTKLRQLIKEIIPTIFDKARHEKVVIFTEYRATQEYLQNHLRRNFGDTTVSLIHGSMNIDQRQQSIRHFEEFGRFLISTEAGGEGINLQNFCHTMVNYDLPWNPSRLVQRIGRLYRYGQQHPVLVFNLHSAETLDSKIVNMMYERIDRIVDDLSGLGVDFDENYRDEVLGQVAELAELDSLFTQAYDKHESQVGAEIDEALEQARELYEKQKDLFSYFTQTLDIDKDGELVLTREHLKAFLNGMCDELEIEQDPSRDGTKIELRLSEELRDRLSLNRTVLNVTLDRRRKGDLRVEVLDWDSKFLTELVKLAKSQEFGGSVAAVQDMPEDRLVVSTLHWQNSRGERVRRVLAVAALDESGEIQLNPPHILEFLISWAENGELPEMGERSTAFDEINDGLNQYLSQGSTPHLHPDGLEYLALAVKGRGAEVPVGGADARGRLAGV